MNAASVPPAEAGCRLQAEDGNHVEERATKEDFLGDLFAPFAVITESATLPAQAWSIPAQEAVQVAGAAFARQVEFAAGRVCARRALARLGCPPFILRNDAQRAPVWPEGMVGSLTHTGRSPGGYCAAAVGRVGDVRALGLDAESAAPLPAHLWRLVLTPEERLWLDGLDEAPAGRGRLAKLIFSAKECFYKAQFPLSRRRLGFQDVAVELALERHGFQARLVAPLSEASALTVARGRFLFEGALVKTGIAIPVGA